RAPEEHLSQGAVAGRHEPGRYRTTTQAAEHAILVAVIRLRAGARDAPSARRADDGQLRDALVVGSRSRTRPLGGLLALSGEHVERYGRVQAVFDARRDDVPVESTRESVCRHHEAFWQGGAGSESGATDVGRAAGSKRPDDSTNRV